MKPAGKLALLFIVLLAGSAGFAPWFFPSDFQEIHLSARFAPPSWPFVFGKDDQGHNLLLKILYGARLSLLVVFSVSFFSGLAGLLLGTAAGLAGGITESLIMAAADFSLAFPKFLLALAFLAMAGPSLGNLIFVLTFSTWAGFARLVRGEVRGLKKREFVQNAVACGAGRTRVVIRHLWPHLPPVLAAHGLFQAGAVLIAESGLNFLGVGVSLETPSWGGLIDSGRRFMLEGPHLIVFPCLALFLFLLSLNILADEVRDRLSLPSSL